MSSVSSDFVFQTSEYTQAVAWVTDRQNQDKTLTQGFFFQDFPSVFFIDLANF